MRWKERDRLYLIATIDDASSRVWARPAAQDTGAENMRVLWAIWNAVTVRAALADPVH